MYKINGTANINAIRAAAEQGIPYSFMFVSSLILNRTSGRKRERTEKGKEESFLVKCNNEVHACNERLCSYGLEGNRSIS